MTSNSIAARLSPRSGTTNVRRLCSGVPSSVFDLRPNLTPTCPNRPNHLDRPSQPGFFSVVALPMYAAFAAAFPSAAPLLAGVRDNHAMWAEEAPPLSPVQPERTSRRGM